MAALFITIVALMCCTNVLSNSNGAPRAACATMSPVHEYQNFPPPPPYRLVLSTHQYDPNSEIIVTLEGNDGETFTGFFIQVRKPDAGTGEAILHGTFAEVDGIAHKECVGEPFGDGDAITHKDNTVKTSVTVVWTAPPEDQGDLEFRVSVTDSCVTGWGQYKFDIITGPSKRQKI